MQMRNDNLKATACGAPNNRDWDRARVRAWARGELGGRANNIAVKIKCSVVAINNDYLKADSQ